MVKRLLFIVLASFILVACQPEVVQVTRIVEKNSVREVTRKVEVPVTIIVTATETPTVEPTQTPWVVTATPTDTPEPTSTSVPTDTPLPTVTNTVVPTAEAVLPTSTQVASSLGKIVGRLGIGADGNTLVVHLPEIIAESGDWIHYWVQCNGAWHAGSANQFLNGQNQVRIDAASGCEGRAVVIVDLRDGNPGTMVYDESAAVLDSLPHHGGGGNGAQPPAVATHEPSPLPTNTVPAHPTRPPPTIPATPTP